MKKSTDEFLNLEQAAALTREYLSRTAASPTAEALRSKCSRGLGPPRVADPHGPPNAAIRFQRSKVVDWCEEQLPHLTRRSVYVLDRTEKMMSSYHTLGGSTDAEKAVWDALVALLAAEDESAEDPSVIPERGGQL